MADIRFLCPECRAKLSIESDRVDMFVTCPACRKSIRPWGSYLLDIKFVCPSCRQRMLIDAGAAGKQVKCPSCTWTVLVPSESAPPRQPAVIQLPITQASPLTTSRLSHPITATTSSLLTEDEVAFLAGDPGGVTRVG